ncbi:MAG TPA: GxxExxY protein [Chitinophagales bacterium]|nr:GxxExxY protein [Chitinophagales bacterium]
MITQEYLNNISYKVIGAAIEVHRHLGPGLLESVYQTCLADELRSRGLKVTTQVKVDILYKGKNLGNHLVLDIMVEDLIILELKAVEYMNPLYEAQLLSYLKLTGKPKGLLINFNSTNISKDLVSLVTEKYRRLGIEERPNMDFRK